MVRVDSSDPARWDDEVRRPATRVLERFLADEDWKAEATRAGLLMEADMPDERGDAERVEAWRKFECSKCGIVVNGERDWATHLRSRRHEKAVRHRKSRARNFFKFLRKLEADGKTEAEKAEIVGQHPVFAGLTVEEANHILGEEKGGEGDEKGDDLP